MPPPPLDPSAVRGVVFDLDGTLVDSYAAIAEALNAARAAHGLGPLADDEVRRRVGRGLESLIAESLGPDNVASGVRVFREHYEAGWARGTTLLPGVAATVDSLARRGLRMAVASNKPARFGDPILGALGLRRHLVAVEGPDTSGVVKPDPEMIRRCLRAMDVPAEAAAYVGDMLLDVESAARAGLPVVLVSGGSADRAALAESGQLVLDRFEDLLQVLATQPAGESA